MASCGTRNVKFQLRRDTTAGWLSKNPILLPGEPSYDSDTNCIKIGDGIRRWTELVPICGSKDCSECRDDWYQKYLINPPDAPLNLRIEGNWNQYINIVWDYPQQINVGFQQKWLPELVNFSAKLRNINFGGVPNTPVSVVTNDATNKFILNRSITGPTGPITLIQLLPRTYNGVNNFFTGPVNITSSGVSHNALQFYNTNFITATGPAGPTGPQMVDIWYENYNTSTGPKKATSAIGGFPPIEPGPPGLPRNLQINSNFSWTDPRYKNLNNYDDPFVTITSYTYHIYIGRSDVRYPNGLGSDLLTGTTQNTYLNSQIYPDNRYDMYVKATNSYNLTGSQANVNTTIPYPNAPVDSFTARYFQRYPNTDIKFFYNNSYQGNVPQNSLLQYNTINAEIDGTGYIQPASNPGKGFPPYGNSPPRNISVNFTREDGLAGFVTNEIPIYGFGKTNNTNQQNLVKDTTNIQIGTLQFTSQASDYYNDEPRQGFYQTIPLLINIPKSNLFDNLIPSYKVYNCSIDNNSLVGGSGFYVSGVRNYNPSFNSASLIESYASRQYVSGINVWGQNVRFNANAVVGNLGDYFFKQNVASFTLKKGTYNADVVYASMNDFTNVNGLTWQTTKELILRDSFYIGNVSLSSLVVNINSAATTTDVGVAHKIVDQPSIDLANLISSSRTIDRNSTSIGQYVNDYGVPLVPYNHTQSIIDANAIQICYGKFRTKTNATSVGYLNYPSQRNYTGISGYKTIMFAWNVVQSPTDYGNSMNIYFNDIEGSVIQNQNNYVLSLENNGRLDVSYKFFSLSTDSLTTGWLSGNVADGTIGTNIANSVNYQTDGLTGLRTSTTNSLNVRVPQLLRVSNSNDVYLFVRISIPMESNFAFSTISCSLT